MTTIHDEITELRSAHGHIEPADMLRFLRRVEAMADALDRIRDAVRPAFGATAQARWERVAADPAGLANLVDACVNGVPNAEEDR